MAMNPKLMEEIEGEPFNIYILYINIILYIILYIIS